MTGLKKGDIIKVDFNPTRGHEQQGYRPALVVSAGRFNAECGFVWLVPITSSTKGRADEISLPDEVAQSCGIEGVILFSQIRAVDLAARPFKECGSVPDWFMDEQVTGRLCAILVG